MKHVCAFCSRLLSPDHEKDGLVSHGICNPCYNHAKASLGVDLKEYLDMLEEPVVLVDSDMHVLSANTRSKEITGKDVTEIIGLIGGEVFECENANLPEGCGRTVHCSGCVIRNSVSDTYKTGDPVNDQPATLHQLMNGVSIPIEMLISTRKTGSVVLLQIELVNPNIS
ncbi:hypothetical protein [uncultured Methanospirillum sp.]|uniref:hypothetical protein n=1 Tax=uncultured Methanospirillum sp. TaxID=262503 RepID=UPI0029C65D7E|nr:hypothetical protein [uncultured Methanospirillum sp.]